MLSRSWIVAPQLRLPQSDLAPEYQQRLASRRTLLTIAADLTRTAVIGNTIVGTVTCAVLWSALSATVLLTWLAALALSTAVRLTTAYHVKARLVHADATGMARAERWMVYNAGGNGLLWGAMTAVALSVPDIRLRAFTSCVAVAMASAGVASNVALPTADARS